MNNDGPDTVNDSSTPSSRVALLVSRDVSLEGLVGRAIGGDPENVPVVRRHARLGPALDVGWRERINVAVIDLRGAVKDEAGLLEAFVTQMPDLPVVVISEGERAVEFGTAMGRSAHWRTVREMIDGEEMQAAIREVLRKRPEEDERRPAGFDPEDGLPYPSVLMDRVQQSIMAQAREGTALAVLVVALNPSGDPNWGALDWDRDRVIREIGRRLLDPLGNGDTVSYLGENRFAILAPTVADRGHAVLVAESLLAAVNETFAGRSEAVESNATVGIAICPEHGRYPGMLLGRAATAAADAYRVNSGYVIYASSEAPRQETATALASELRDAIDQGLLVLHYQPLSDLRTGRIDTLEALVRWQHPEHGLLRPNDFVPLAERTGLVLGMTLWVLDEAVRQCAGWRRAGSAVTVTVNVSPQTIHVMDLPEIVRGTLTRHGLPPSGLALEITEHALLTDLRGAEEVLREIEAMGVRIIIDDFGIGYSSLALLRRLPVGALKIDLSFVRTIEHDDQNAAMVMSIIDLGHNLGLEVVAEGVESDAIWDLLAAHGCATAQGYFVGHPVPAHEIDLGRRALGAGGGTKAGRQRESRARSLARRALPRRLWGGGV